jgi:hypothetical protein
MTAGDLGPWICTGETSGSEIATSMPANTAMPFAQRMRSLSEAESQKCCSDRRNRTGSLTIPPSSEVTTM